MGWFANLVSSLTGDSRADASRVGHDVRTDSGAREGKDKEYFKEAPDWAEHSTESGNDLFPKDK